MAEQSGLPDISKANFYGQTPDKQQELLDANEAALKALQQRYENPNWFNVAAGFFKPQLGGFAASLGSASQALGENLEKQRANELPVAQYRTQVALMKNQMAQNQFVNNLVANNKGPVTGELLQEAMKRAPDAPATKALQASFETSQKERGLAASELQNALQRVQYADQRHLPHNPQDDALIAAGSITQPPVAGRAAPVSTLPATGTAAENQAAGQAAQNKAAASNENIPILQAELKKAQDRLAANPNDSIAQAEVASVQRELARTSGKSANAPAGAPAAPPRPQQKFTPTVAMPDLSGQNPNDAEYLRKVAGDQAAVVEKPHQDEVAALAYLTRHVNFNQATGDTQAALTLMDKYPGIAKKVFDILRQAGPMAAAGQEGVGISAAPWGVQLKIPAKAWLSASITDEPVSPGGPSARSIADKLAQHLASSAFYGMVSRGVNPETAGSEKMTLAMTQEPLMLNTAAAAYTSLQRNLNDFKMAKEVHDAYAQERAHVHKTSLTPLHDIATQSDRLKIIKRKYELANQAVHNNFMGGQPAQ